uniref:Putative secreted protein n=1 Tax=Rhipicephalus microplus TaxID=6941 RepID=A0A6M2DAK3_RHIMP
MFCFFFFFFYQISAANPYWRYAWCSKLDCTFLELGTGAMHNALSSPLGAHPLATSICSDCSIRATRAIGINNILRKT